MWADVWELRWRFSLNSRGDPRPFGPRFRSLPALSAARRAGLLAAAAWFAPLAAHAELSVTAAQFHVRTGMMSGSVSGASSASAATQTVKGFSVMNSLDTDVEIFRSTKRSIFARSSLAYDLSDSRVKYFYFGIGRRWYLGSDGMIFDSSEQGTGVAWSPKNRYYLGIDLGLSQTFAIDVSKVLGEYSTGFDFGGHGGAIIPIGKSVGLDVQGGASYSLGFTSVSVTTTIFRFLVGLSLYL